MHTTTRVGLCNVIGAMLALLFVVTLAGCGTGRGVETTVPASTSTPTGPASDVILPAQRLAGTIKVGGRKRSYTVVLPEIRGGGLVPLVIALHGGGGSGAQFERTSHLTPKALAAGFAVVYPDGTSGGPADLNTWNAGSCCGSAVGEDVDDVGFVRMLIDELTTRFPIDPRRVFATGHSNGGMLSYRLACEAADRIAAIMANSAADGTTSCTPARAVPILHLHSRLDETVPIAGGVGTGPSRVAFVPLETTIGNWVTRDACSNVPVVTVDPGRFTRSSYAGCRDGVIVELVVTDDGGHGWPGGEPGSARGDTPSTVIDANDELLAFFARWSLP